MDMQGGSFNMTDPLSSKYQPFANMIFQNKTLILVTKQQHSSSSQQMALLAGMAFIGGIVAGLLIRCIYYGIVKFFVKSVDQLVSQQQQQQANAPSFVEDSFRVANDEPPDYVEVVTSTNGFRPPGGRGCKDLVELKVGEDMPPPAYVSVVSGLGRVMRSMST